MQFLECEDALLGALFSTIYNLNLCSRESFPTSEEKQPKASSVTQGTSLWQHESMPLDQFGSSFDVIENIEIPELGILGN